jgi:hypothetical protein
MKPIIENDIVPIIKSVCSLNLKTEFLLLFSFGGFSLGMITGFVTDWIFDPAVSYFAMIGLILADHVAGMTVAIKGKRFKTQKALRIFWTLIAHTGLLIFATNIARGTESLSWLNEAIFVPICVVNLISLIKNLTLLGLIKKDLANFFYKNIDVHKNDFAKKPEDPNLDRRGNDGC